MVQINLEGNTVTFQALILSFARCALAFTQKHSVPLLLAILPNFAHNVFTSLFENVSVLSECWLRIRVEQKV